jgi:hypothetical protein
LSLCLPVYPTRLPAWVQICTATLTVVGGSLLNLNGGGFTPPDPTVDPTPVSPWNCPDGTYFDAELICPIW